jgi:hypothetical protein
VTLANTYGEHQDAAAGALSRLLASDIPITAHEIAIIDACRSMIRASLIERLRLLGAEPRHQAQQRPPLMRLAQLADVLPSRDPYADDSLSPLDALEHRPSTAVNETTRAWQLAARATVLATDALAGDQGLEPLLSRDESIWRLAADAANSVEALALLNQDLIEVGALPGRSPHLDDMDQMRQEVSYIARMGDWYGSDASLDLATRGAGGTREAWQVHLVRTAADLEPAERRLGEYLAPKLRSSQHRLTRSEAMAITTTHLRVASHLIEVCDTMLGTQDKTTQSLRVLKQSLNELRSHLRRLHDTAPAAPRLNVMGQLTELSVGISRANVSSGMDDLSPVQLDALAQTMTWACGRYATTLTYESTRPTGKLRFAPVIPNENPHTKPAHPERRSLLLLQGNAPLVPGRFPHPPETHDARALLRVALDKTPTTQPPKLPSPVAGRGYGR